MTAERTVDHDGMTRHRQSTNCTAGSLILSRVGVHGARGGSDGDVRHECSDAARALNCSHAPMPCSVRLKNTPFPFTLCCSLKAVHVLYIRRAPRLRVRRAGTTQLYSKAVVVLWYTPCCSRVGRADAI